MSSVKVNYALQLANTAAQMLFPLLTFPYACRIVGADGIGLVSWFDSIASYIILFVNLGIPIYAIRETARVRSDAESLNRTSAEVFALHSLLSLLGFVAVAAVLMFVGEVRAHAPIFLIVCSTMIFNVIGCEWFFLGTEDFKYITIRGLVVKVLAVALLFLLVKTRDDLVYYAIYTVVGAVGGNVFNFFRIRSKAPQVGTRWRGLNLRRHLVPAFEAFAFTLVISIYLRLNVILLGSIQSAAAVGLYAAATKLLTVFKMLPKVLGDVMMPRMSSLVAEGHDEEVRSLLQKSYDFTLLSVFPLVVFLVASAPNAIALLCGQEFLPAATAARIVAFVMLFSAVTNVIGMQTLYPQGKFRIVVWSCAIGAVGDLIACLVLVPRFSYNGAAVAFLIAEILVAVAQISIGWRFIPFRFLMRRHVSIFAAAAAMIAASAALSRVSFGSDFATIAAVGCGGFTAYAAVLLIARDPIIVEVMRLAEGFIRRVR